MQNIVLLHVFFGVAKFGDIPWICVPGSRSISNTTHEM